MDLVGKHRALLGSRKIVGEIVLTRLLDQGGEAGIELAQSAAQGLAIGDAAPCYPERLEGRQRIAPVQGQTGSTSFPRTV